MNARVLVSTKDLPKSEWLKYRQMGIGGSDAGAIVGVNPWKSPFGVYLEKINEVEQTEENEAMYWGCQLEDVIAKEFRNKHPELSVYRKNAILQHPEHRFMLANVDRLIVSDDGYGVLEIKTANEYSKDKFDSENIPDSYYLQIQHYLAVLGPKYTHGWLAVLIGGNKYREFYVARDEVIIEQLTALEKAFWEDHVLKQVPPPLDGSQDAEGYLNNLYPKARDKSEIEINNPDVANALEELINLKETMTNMDKRKALLEQTIKSAMQDHEVAYIGDKKIKWSNVSSNRIDSKKLKAEQPEIYKQYCSESFTRRFSI